MPKLSEIEGYFPPQPALPALRVYRLHELAALPVRKTAGSLGYDIAAFALDRNSRSNTILVGPGTVRSVETKLIVLPPPGWAIEIRMRSSLGAMGLIIPNAPGTFDLDYTGECLVLLANVGHRSVSITHGMRIAQLILVPAAPPFPVEELRIRPEDPPSRGAKGFGSTGL